MLHTKFQAPEPSGSEERDCLTFFLIVCVSMVLILNPRRGTILYPGATFEQT